MKGVYTMYRYRWILPLLLLATLILSACEPVLLVEGRTPVATEFVDTESASIPWDEIFVIGVEDHGWSEFASDGFDQYQDFVCHIDVDCTVADIPAGLYEGDSPRSYRDEAPRLTIVFQLSRDYSELMLHLARAGSETTAVFVDDGEPLLVTGEMLGSRDGGIVGSYDLPLGPLQAGSHSIAFDIPDDSMGNGGFVWDALSLTAR